MTSTEELIRIPDMGINWKILCVWRQLMNHLKKGQKVLHHYKNGCCGMWPTFIHINQKTMKGHNEHFYMHYNGSILKPWHSASGSFMRKNINKFVVGVHILMCSRALLKLGDSRWLVNCSIVIWYLSIQTNGQDSAHTQNDGTWYHLIIILI